MPMLRAGRKMLRSRVGDVRAARRRYGTIRAGVRLRPVGDAQMERRKWGVGIVGLSCCCTPIASVDDVVGVVNGGGWGDPPPGGRGPRGRLGLRRRRCRRVPCSWHGGHPMRTWGDHPRIHAGTGRWRRVVPRMHRLLHRRMMRRRRRLRLLVVAGPLGGPPSVTTAHS